MLRGRGTRDWQSLAKIGGGSWSGAQSHQKLPPNGVGEGAEYVRRAGRRSCCHAFRHPIARSCFQALNMSGFSVMFQPASSRIVARGVAAHVKYRRYHIVIYKLFNIGSARFILSSEASVLALQTLRALWAYGR